MGKSKFRRRKRDYTVLEKTVLLLEKCLIPGARVEHDVKFEDPATGAIRQCDVVIYQGAPPRQLMTIVEVQKRKKKVDTPQFDAWVSKKDSIGANCLIGVSKIGFYKPVIRAAELKGNSVKLLTIEELEAIHSPVTFQENAMPFRVCRKTSTGVRIFAGRVHRGDKPTFNINGPYLSLGTRRFSLLEASLDVWSEEEVSRLPSGNHTLIRRFPSNGLRYADANLDAEIEKLEFEFSINIEWVSLPVKYSDYRQVKEGSSLLHLVQAKGILLERELIFDIAFRPSIAGIFEIAGVQMQGGEGLKADHLTIVHQAGDFRTEFQIC